MKYEQPKQAAYCWSQEGQTLRVSLSLPSKYQCEMTPRLSAQARVWVCVCVCMSTHMICLRSDVTHRRTEDEYRRDSGEMEEVGHSMHREAKESYKRHKELRLQQSKRNQVHVNVEHRGHPQRTNGKMENYCKPRLQLHRGYYSRNLCFSL